MPIPHRTYFVGGAALLLVLVAVMGAVSLNAFHRYQGEGLGGSRATPRPNVVITRPRLHESAPLESPLPVNVRVDGGESIVSIELLVNGALMGAQPAPAGGLARFDAPFLWSPGAPGDYLLIARAVGAAGSAVLSAAVAVTVAPHEPRPGATAGEGFQAGPSAVVPSSQDSASRAAAPQAPRPGDGVGAAHIGPSSLGDWLTALTNREPPNAPELVLAVHDCAVTLQIHDRSNNEEGFQVYRSTDGEPGWAEIATLRSQSASAWVAYEDRLGADRGVYYVASANRVARATSNLAIATVPAAGCAPEAGNRRTLVAEPVSFATDLPVTRAYCYQSLGGRSWERWPETGFLMRRANGFDLSAHEFAFALNSLDGTVERAPQALDMECWGWNRAALISLGEVHFSSQEIASGRAQAQDHGRAPSLSIGFNFTKRNPWDKKGTPKPKSAQLPNIFAFVSYNPEACHEQLPPGAAKQNPWGTFLYCFSIPPYTFGAASKQPQPYLIWSVSSKFCPAGQFKDCVFMPALASWSKDHGGQMYYSIGRPDIGGGIQIDTTAGDPYNNDRRSWVVNPWGSGCGWGPPQTFTVTLHYQDALVGTLIGPTSNVVTMPCPFFPSSVVNLSVTFETLTLSLVDDNEPDPEDVELYGSLQATSSNGSQGLRNLAHLGSNNYNSPYNCPTEGANQLSLAGTAQCPPSLTNGSYSFAQFYLCKSEQTWECLDTDVDLTPLVQKNNTMHVTVGDGDHVLLQVKLMDYDTGGADDIQCFAILDTGSRTLKQWAATFGEVFTLIQPNNGNSACQVKIVISVAGS